MAKQATKALKTSAKVARAAVRHGNKVVQHTSKAVRRTRKAVQALEAEQVHRPRPLGRFVEVDGVRVHYIVRGKGRPVVLVHGNGTMAEDFVICGLLDQLAKHYRVIALDRPASATRIDHGFGSGRPLRRHTLCIVCWSGSMSSGPLSWVTPGARSWPFLSLLEDGETCAAWCFCPATTTRPDAPTWPSRPRSRSGVSGTRPAPWCPRRSGICSPRRCSGTCS